MNFLLLNEDLLTQYISLLHQLYEPNITPTIEHISKYKDIFENIKVNPNHNIYIGIDKDVIVCCGTLLIEERLVLHKSKIGHIEDIVVDCKYRSLGYGKRMVEHLICIAKQKGCYKTILSSNLSNLPFYQKCGLELCNHQMSKYF